ncbi:glycoprotein 3-alpha-L-fucosyltransferase A-like isoform X1 [Mizuhopecten yessoensis]|uniref:glycoprotein 3-alpha-L-fucosyltransferase A-like isoform X1 n=1 Tax=Mizuhopecten yessoensis TaxID=6573 RepID=UPI000B459742|nr:glycoprotein 3-alpha-L-fucosyltransferase A-like isoform X1 [Mizuhopecten yessoensis]
MSQNTRYVQQGTVILVVFAVMMFLTAKMIGVPRYHLNLNQPAFLVKTYPEVIQVLYFNKPEWVSGKEFEGCEYPCEMVWGSKDFDTAKVVIFHGPRLGKINPPKKSRAQLWIMHGMESPPHYHNDLSQWSNLFNWTFTYRRDSDVLTSYSEFKQVPSKITTPNITTQWMKKERMTAWMVSNCGTPSKRERYKQILQKAIDIHVYGGCGTYRCARSNENSCMDILQRHYKYYLAFENSLCVDYVTEKAFKTYIFSPSTIPVMRGGTNYSLYFPPRSYLDAKDFKSAYELGKAMHVSNMKIRKLENIFSWTKTTSINQMIKNHDSWCSLCERIHRSDSYKRLYSNIKFWLNDIPRSACKSPTDLTR